MMDAYLTSMNTVTAFAYFSLTYQLYSLFHKAQQSSVLSHLQASADEKKQNLARIITALSTLFIAFISLCGLTHTFAVLAQITSDNEVLVFVQRLILGCCAAVSILTALVGSRLFPMVVELLSKFELNAEGNLQHIENYMHEVVNLVRESVMLLSEDMVVLRSNEASKTLFGRPSLLGERFVQFIHPDDVKMFQSSVHQIATGYSNAPTTLEYRVLKSLLLPPVPVSIKPLPKRDGSIDRGDSTSSIAHRMLVRGGGAAKIHAGVQDSNSDLSAAPPSTAPSSTQRMCTADGESARDAAPDAYIWVESAMCKGMRLTTSGDFEYDVKMVTRNIDERKKQAQNQLEMIVRASEEQAHINAAKLRYISCIAHDLKTPLQSFCFSLDLLQQTPMLDEQRELVQQANTAVDLMKLTISQTMDISKTLSGGKIVPRCTTVLLSSVIERVQVIIHGYGKQVPITFKVAPDVCDAVITDEEWLWQMLLNLLTNACKYTDKGSIQVNVQVDPSITLPITLHDALLFEVMDTGVGVKGDKIAHIFDAFSQVQEGQVTGTGLGLFGVRTRAEGLQGTCGARHNIASSTGTGTVIWFAIPYQPDMAHVSDGERSRSSSVNAFDDGLSLGARILPVSSAPSEIALAMDSTKSSISASLDTSIFRDRQLTAMVVDDTLTVRKLMEKLLLKMGFARVDCYENGSKGLDAMMAGQVDIVFSDVQMPIMTGPEMTARFRAWEAQALRSGARTERQLIVAVTANGGQVEGDVLFDEVCAKPLGVAAIQGVIKRLL